MTRVSTSALSVSVIRCRRYDDNPTCSGLALGRLCASTVTATIKQSRAAGSVAFTRIMLVLLVEVAPNDRDGRRLRAPRYQRHHMASSNGGRRKYQQTLTTFTSGSILHLSWGCSSVGRAQGWQSWGQGFEPPQLHQNLAGLRSVSVAPFVFRPPSELHPRGPRLPHYPPFLTARWERTLIAQVLLLM